MIRPVRIVTLTVHCVAQRQVAGISTQSLRSCNRTFGAVTSTPVSGPHHKELWLMVGESLTNGDTVALAARYSGKAACIGYRWRRRFLAWFSTDIKN